MGKVAIWTAAVAHSVPAVLGSVSIALLVTACTGTLDGQAGPRDSWGEDSQAGGAGDPIGPEIDPETFEGPILSAPVASTRLVRLSHRQWENTVRDVLRLPEPLGLSRAFVAEPLRGTFDTNGSILTVSQDMGRDYQTAAEKLGALVARDPERLSALAPDDGSDATDRARRFIESFGLRVFRRPLGEDEVAAALDLFAKGPSLIESGDDFADGVELVVSYLFQSPHFIYRTEVSEQVSSDGKIPLNSYEIASRLSYALTATMPDDGLFGAAAEDALRDKHVVREQAERLLGTPAARETIGDFHSQLLHMSEFETITRDQGDFPLFGEGVGEDLKREALTFVDDVVFEQNLGLEELLSAPYTFANARVAGLYEAYTSGDVSDDEFVRVELDPSQRAGLLTQVGFLSAHGEGTTPNIIMRGVNIARRVLCAELPPPPKDVPPLPEIAPDATNRDRVEGLTKDAPCSTCHTHIINPLGYALENLDGVGRYRTEENGITIDASASYVLDGKSVSFNGPVELAQRIAESQQAHDCYARHWVEFLYGRDVLIGKEADRYLVQQAGAISRNLSSVQNLLVELVATDAFLTRLPEN